MRRLIMTPIQRRVFFSFHYKKDNWRASQIRNIGVVNGNQPARDNDWESIKGGGDRAIKSWIDKQMKGRSCVIVLVGEETAGRKWIDYEIQKAWEEGKGLLGIQIHKLVDSSGMQGFEGENPFDSFELSGKRLSSIVKLKKPRQITSRGVYRDISTNIAEWIEEAIEIRKRWKS